MDEKFIRVFAHGLEEGEELTVEINGKKVVFTQETAQQDIEVKKETATKGKK